MSSCLSQDKRGVCKTRRICPYVILSKKTIKYEANNNHNIIVHISLLLCK